METPPQPERIADAPNFGMVPELDGAALRALLDPATPAGPDSLQDAERRHIARVLDHTGGNKKQAALLLGISRSTLLHKVRKYRIVTPRS